MSIFKVFGFAMLLGMPFLAEAQELSFENCQALDQPVVYRNDRNDKYLLAIDSCMQDLFERLRLQRSQFSPPGNRFANAEPDRGGFGLNYWGRNEELKLLFEAHSQNTTFGALFEGLGLTIGYPQSDAASYRRFPNTVATNLTVCCDENRLVACGRSTARYRKVGVCRGMSFTPVDPAQRFREISQRLQSRASSELTSRHVRTNVTYRAEPGFCGLEEGAYLMEVQVKKGETWTTVKRYGIRESDADDTWVSTLIAEDSCQ